MVEFDESNMKKFIQDILVKAEYCKMIFTSAASIKDFAGQGGYIFQTKKLSNEQAYELLSSKVKSPKDLRKEIGELPTRISSKTSQPGAVRELNHNHDFVKILNGHPHSIILVSTLKNGNFL